MLIEGAPTDFGNLNFQYRSIRAHRNDFTNGFHYISGTIGGSKQASGAGTAQLALHEYTRSFVYLSKWDVVVVYDRVNSDNQISSNAWTNSRARAELYVHTPHNVSPTLGTGTVQWEYATGLGVKVSNLLPANPTRTIQNEATVWPAEAHPPIAKLGNADVLTVGYDVKIVPASENKWNTFLNVWDAYGSSTPATVSLVQDTTHMVDATLITKGRQSVLVSFNAVQGPDLPLNTGKTYYWNPGVPGVLNNVKNRSSGFSLAWTSAVATKALLFDLNHLATWTYTINGGAPQSLTVDSNNIGVIDIPTTGEITLAITGEGSP